MAAQAEEVVPIRSKRSSWLAMAIPQSKTRPNDQHRRETFRGVDPDLRPCLQPSWPLRPDSSPWAEEEGHRHLHRHLSTSCPSWEEGVVAEGEAALRSNSPLYLEEATSSQGTHPAREAGRGVPLHPTPDRTSPEPDELEVVGHCLHGKAM